ncbi:GNAT family N-acetyltransferase [Streptomyces sp. NPDC048504]|uniref:GNAT family N-acetyltransferase n=1 Tax=Streptomyces sp. NPDC048504 TaxID=3365559 RepID=UPI003710F600
MISLRELSLGDAPALQRIYSDASVRYLPRMAMTAESAASWLADHVVERHATTRTMYCFGIDHADDLVGVIKLRPDRTSAALSYILRHDVWGHGYATKAVALVLDFASSALGLASVDAKHHPDNHTSGRVLIKSGFTCTGRSGAAVTYIRHFASCDSMSSGASANASNTRRVADHGQDTDTVRARA